MSTVGFTNLNTARDQEILMANLPRQAQAALERADATLAAAISPPPTETPPAPTPPPPAPPPGPDPVELPPSLPPVPTPAPQPDWEHKYRVLQGMFNKLSDEMKELKRASAVAPTPAPTPAPRPAADPKDVEAFGLDMVSMVQRTTEQYLAGARAELMTQLDSLVQRIGDLEQAIHGTQATVAKTAEDIFFERLAEKVPNWNEINRHPAFLAYLAEPDPIYGFPRQNALLDAQEKGDVNRVIAIFRSFLATLPPPPASAPSESPSPRSAGAPPPATSAAALTTYTQAEVASFYADVRRGMYRGKDAERQRLESLYNAAMAEGRIV